MLPKGGDEKMVDMEDDDIFNAWFKMRFPKKSDDDAYKEEWFNRFKGGLKSGVTQMDDESLKDLIIVLTNYRSVRELSK